MAAGAVPMSSFLRLTIKVMTTYSFSGEKQRKRPSKMVRSTVRHVPKVKKYIYAFEFSNHATFSVSKGDFFIALSTDGVSLIITFAANHVSQGITYFLRPGS